MSAAAHSPGITGAMSDLYDVFVDWPGRLGRELPGLLVHLAGARRVLDLGCGTGRHVAALLAEGFDAHGADVSADMLAHARSSGLPAERLHAWRMGDPVPGTLRALAPFDAAIALGSVWPQLADPRDLAATASALHGLIAPGGTLVLGLKAFDVRRERREPYLPLLRRVDGARTLWFVRFVDFEVPQPAGGPRLCDLHMTVVAGTAAEPAPEVLLHRASRVRAWAPDELRRWLEEAGFVAVRVGGRLDDPGEAATGDDVFAVARRPA